MPEKPSNRGIADNSIDEARYIHCGKIREGGMIADTCTVTVASGEVQGVALLMKLHVGRTEVVCQINGQAAE